MTTLRVLKSGIKGDDVASWQKFLQACGFTPAVTGTFDDATVQATTDFQRLHNLPATGRANNMTFGMAMLLGLQVIVEEK
jgi:peptidoglycan hydrolase-like protein with peptidoglycan-binding domain